MYEGILQDTSPHTSKVVPGFNVVTCTPLKEFASLAGETQG